MRILSDFDKKVMLVPSLVSCCELTTSYLLPYFCPSRLKKELVPFAMLTSCEYTSLGLWTVCTCLGLIGHDPMKHLDLRPHPGCNHGKWRFMQKLLQILKTCTNPSGDWNPGWGDRSKLSWSKGWANQKTQFNDSHDVIVGELGGWRWELRWWEVSKHL